MKKFKVIAVLAVSLGLSSVSYARKHKRIEAQLVNPEKKARLIDRLGLSDSATDEEIKKAARDKHIEKLGLSADASEKEIKEAMRLRHIDKLGLSEDATREEIKEAMRARHIKKLGLSADASEEEIKKALKERRHERRGEGRGDFGQDESSAINLQFKRLA